MAAARSKSPRSHIFCSSFSENENDPYSPWISATAGVKLVVVLRIIWKTNAPRICAKRADSQSALCHRKTARRPHRPINGAARINSIPGNEPPKRADPNGATRANPGKKLKLRSADRWQMSFRAAESRISIAPDSGADSHSIATDGFSSHPTVLSQPRGRSESSRRERNHDHAEKNFGP